MENSARNFTAYMGVAKAISLNAATNASAGSGDGSGDDSDGAMGVQLSVVGALSTAFAAVVFSAWL